MSTHIKNLCITSFRGIKDLNLLNLGRVNILVGKNNTGKTSTLEAIHLFVQTDKSDILRVATGQERVNGANRNNLSIM